MGSKSAPSAPDYRGAAEEQAKSSAEGTRQQTFANRPNQNTPWGSSTWTPSSQIDPSTGQPVTGWQQDITLSPEEQAAFESQSRVRSGLSGTAEDLIGRTQESFAEPMDYSNLPDYAQTPGRLDYYRMGYDDPSEGVNPWAEAPQAGTAAEPTTGYAGVVGSEISNDLSQIPLDAGGGYQQSFADTQFQRQMSLEDPRMQRDMTQMDVQLRAQGLRPGTEAYDNAMGDLRDQQGERRSRASQDAVRLGAEEQQRQFGREFDARSLGGREVMDLYGRRMGSAVQQDAQRQQQFQEGQQRESQRLDRELKAAGYSDNQRRQMVQEKMAINQQEFDQTITKGAEGFDKSMQRANYQNSLRQAQIAEEMQKRGASLNEINALLYGNQIQTPEMPGFSNAERRESTQYNAAAQNQGQFDNARYATALGPVNSLLSNIGG